MATAWDETDQDLVWVDHSTLKADPAGTETRYTVLLRGQIDERWVGAFRGAQAESTGYRRFRLDPPSRTISFSCHNAEGTGLVFDALDRLDTLLALANKQVTT